MRKLIIALFLLGVASVAQAQTVSADRFRLNTGPCYTRSGAGTPEGAVTGNVCDTYIRTDGALSTTIYIKTSGTGNTGWEPVKSAVGTPGTVTSVGASLTGATFTGPVTSSGTLAGTWDTQAANKFHLGPATGADAAPTWRAAVAADLGVGSITQAYNAKLAGLSALADAAGWYHSTGAGVYAWSTPTKSDVGLGSVENTALSTWAGTSNIVTVGTLTGGATGAGFTVNLATSTMSGDLPDANLSANVPLLNAANTFTGYTATSGVVATYNTGASGRAGIIHVNDNLSTYSLSFGAETDGAFVVFKDRYAANAGTQLMKLTQAGALITTAGVSATTGAFSGDFAVATTKFTVAAATGNTVVGGTLESLTHSPAATITSNLGSASKIWLTGYVQDLRVYGRLTTYELLVSQLRASNGGVFISDTAKATSVTDLGASSYQVNVETIQPFAANDLVRAQRFTGTGTYRVDLTVTAVDAGGAHFTGTAASGIPTAGMEFVRLGNTSTAARQNSIYMTATSDAGSPAIAVIDGMDAFADWATAAPPVAQYRALMGQLNGSYGYAASLYGFCAGDYAAASICTDATNGVRFRASGTEVATFDTTGLTLTLPAAYADVNSYRFKAATGATGTVFGMYAQQDAGYYRYLALRNIVTSDTDAQILLSTSNSLGKTPTIGVTANNTAQGGLGHITLSAGAGGDIAFTSANITLSTTGDLTPAGSIGLTGTRVSAGFFTALTVTNTISGTASAVTGFSPVAGQTLTLTTGGTLVLAGYSLTLAQSGTLGTAAYTATGAYLAAAGTAADSDKLDGQHGAYYQTASSALTTIAGLTPTQYWIIVGDGKTWTTQERPLAFPGASASSGSCGGGEHVNSWTADGNGLISGFGCSSPAPIPAVIALQQRVTDLEATVSRLLAILDNRR